MATKTVLDTFLNFAVGRDYATASTDNTTVTKLETGLTNIQKIAWEVYRVEYQLYGPWNLAAALVAAGTYVSFGWTQNSEATNAPYGLMSASVLDNVQLRMTYQPAAVSLDLRQWPIVHQFEEPLLVLPQTLYTFLDWNTTANLGATDAITSRLWYREKELSSEDWYDLLQLRLPLGVIA